MSAARSLRSPDSGTLGQGLRFAISGGIVMLVYLATTTLLASVVGLHFQLALAIGFCAGLLVHFTLQRVFVWTHHEEFALPLHDQIGRYLLVAGAQYGLTAASTALLPAALGVPTEAVYLATVAVIVCANFIVFRHGIFHAKPASRAEPPVARIGA
jgi:putative flippase GtrA